VKDYLAKATITNTKPALAANVIVAAGPMSAATVSGAAADARDGNTTPPTTDQLANAPTPDSAGQGATASKAPVSKQTAKAAAAAAKAATTSTAEQKQKSRHDPVLLAKVKTQIEFYFSTQNLQNDPFLVSKMNAEKFVPISVIASFRKISELTTDTSLIVQAVRDSSVCSVDSTCTMLKPTSMKFQERNTIILRDISSDATEQELRTLFSDTAGCGAVVSLRSDIGNTWFVTMETEDAARDSLLALKSSGKGFKGKPIRGGLKSKSVARSSFAPSAVDAPAFVPGQGFGSSLNSKPMPIKSFTPAAAQASQLPPGTATTMARYYNMTPEQMKQALAANPYFAAQVYAYATAMAMQGMAGGGGAQQQRGYRAYGDNKDGKYGNNNRRNANSNYNQRSNSTTTTTTSNNNNNNNQRGQQQRRQQNQLNNGQHSNARKGANAVIQQQNNKKQHQAKDQTSNGQQQSNKKSKGTAAQDSKASKSNNKATTAAAAAAAAAKKAAAGNKDSTSPSSMSSSSASSNANTQSRPTAKQQGRTAGVGRAPARVGNNNNHNNTGNTVAGNKYSSGSNSTSKSNSTNNANNSNKNNNIANNNNNGKGGGTSEKKGKKAAAAAGAAEATPKVAPAVPNVTSTSMFPSLGGKSGSAPAAAKSAATSLWSASAAVKQKPASSKLRQKKPRPSAAAAADESGASSGGKKKKGKGSSSASGKAGSVRAQARGEASKTSAGSKSSDSNDADSSSTPTTTTTTATNTSSAPAPFSWAATVAKTANKPVREKKEKPAAKPAWGSEATKKKKGKTPSSPSTKAAVTAIVASVVDSVASDSGSKVALASEGGESSSVVAAFKSPLRKKSPVTSWADEADTDDEDDVGELNFSGSKTSPKNPRSGGLAAAFGSGAKSANASPTVSPRRGWETTSVTKHWEQNPRTDGTSDNISGRLEGSSTSSGGGGGAWADVVKRTDGTSPTGQSSSQLSSKVRDGAWNAGADSGSSTTTAGSEPSEPDSNGWVDRSETSVLPVNTRAALFASATGAQPAKRESREDNSSWGDDTR
jgi:hypothetical protein